MDIKLFESRFISVVPSSPLSKEYEEMIVSAIKEYKKKSKSKIFKKYMKKSFIEKE